MISDSDKKTAKETFDQLIELADEFGPQLKKIIAKYLELLTDSKQFDQLVVSGVAAQLACAMLRDGDASNYSSQEIANRALTIAKLIVQGAKE